jgi:hypothetical protein
MKRYPITGSDVAAARADAQITQRQLAALAGLHVNSVKRLERFAFIPRSSSHAFEACRSHLPLLKDIPVSSLPRVIPRPVFDPEQFSEAQENAGAQHEVKERPPKTYRTRKADRPKCGAKTRKGTPCQAPFPTEWPLPHAWGALDGTEDAGGTGQNSGGPKSEMGTLCRACAVLSQRLPRPPAKRVTDGQSCWGPLG